MGKKIFGWALFGWMSIAVFGAARNMFQHSGIKFRTELAATVFCGALAAIGLAMALGKSKSPIDTKG